MKEELLHYIWRYKLFYTSGLCTSDKKEVQVVTVGEYNLNSGPDFFNAKIRIEGQLWAGNVEIHIKSSDWYLHNHENDTNYDNVILHVVWENDVEVFNSENACIPTFELKDFVSNHLLENYEKLFSKPQKWINCEPDISFVDQFVLKNWQERLYIERLEGKAEWITNMLSNAKFDWEDILFQLLAKNFGLKVNSEVFLKMASSLNYGIVRKESQDITRLESLLFGQLGMLNTNSEIPYFNFLKKEYNYQIKKYKLNSTFIPVQYFRLRPMNFPTIRISQLANLINKKRQLFSDLMQLKTKEAYYAYFDVATSEFWETHYTFEKESKKRIKKLTKPFIDLLLLNTIIPLKFVYLKHLGKLETTSILKLAQEISPEKNNIIEKFKNLKLPVSNAFDTQALLQLKSNYCVPQKCLHCAVGNELLRN